MSVLEKLASALGQRDEGPNMALAASVAAAEDFQAVGELVEHLSDKNKDVQSDCIKVLYEIGVIKPEMIAPYVDKFAALLDSKNNRLAWGAMTALHAASKAVPDRVYEYLP